MGPAKLRYIKNPKQPFHMVLFTKIMQNGTMQNTVMRHFQMENISTFLNAIKEYGVPEISCFQTVDLYEKKQLYKVFECIRSLAAVVCAGNC